MIEPNYKFAREMARQILRKHNINNIPTDLQIICERLGLEFIELDDPDESDGAVLEMEGGLRGGHAQQGKTLCPCQVYLGP